MAKLAVGGPAILPAYQVIDHLSKGRLVHKPPNWSLPSGGIHVVHPAPRFRPQK